MFSKASLHRTVIRLIDLAKMLAIALGTLILLISLSHATSGEPTQTSIEPILLLLISFNILRTFLKHEVIDLRELAISVIILLAVLINSTMGFESILAQNSIPTL